VVLFVAGRKLAAPPVFGGFQLGDAARLLLRDVALPALFGGQRLFLVPAPHAQDLVAVVALFLLGLRVVRLSLGRQLRLMLIAQRRDGLLVLLAHPRHLGREPVGGLRLLVGEPALQAIDLGPVGG